MHLFFVILEARKFKTKLLTLMSVEDLPMREEIKNKLASYSEVEPLFFFFKKGLIL